MKKTNASYRDKKRSEEIEELWRAIHALEDRLNKPMCGCGIDDPDDE